MNGKTKNKTKKRTCARYSPASISRDADACNCDDKGDRGRESESWRGFNDVALRRESARARALIVVINYWIYIVRYVRKAASHDGRSIIPKDTPTRSAITNARTSCCHARIFIKAPYLTDITRRKLKDIRCP